MTAKVWFVHRDRFADQRYSDGVWLCVAPRLASEGRGSGERALGLEVRGELGCGELGRRELGAGELAAEPVYFYCDEYQLLWDSLEVVGQIEHAVPDNPRITIRPATLPEICAAGLCEYIDEVVEIDGARTMARIQLR